MMKTLTKKELLEWARSQPNHREFDMETASLNVKHDNDLCGCLMVEWARDHYPNAEFIDCGATDIDIYTIGGGFEKVLLDDYIQNIIEDLGIHMHSHGVFGDLKK